MRLVNHFIAITIGLLVLCCGDTNTTKKSGLSINTNSKIIQLGDQLNLSINNPKKLNIESVSYSLNGQPIEENYLLEDVPLGKNMIEANISYNDEIETISKDIEIYNNQRPDIYTYEIVNSYPHDITSYTQGLEFYNGQLFESTGQRGESKLRKLEFETGKVLKNVDLASSFFGEGLTILNDSIYQLTWQSKRGFIYNVDSFERIGSFNYGNSKEGWGLCNDGKQLYKSDGTEKIWLIDKSNLTETHHIEVYTDKGKIPSLNELEWINGKIYANIYQRNGVVIINPKNGAVEGVIDFKPLRSLVTQHDDLDVLNGIAYNPERNTIFVTGKNWDKIFEVTISKK
ncbi:glutaminyl-peptide cyclotransferase [Winogradskyella alexanderae]|uniref:Glutaminyl-peptide cyclotransferase n=1 Tax=Winogradskyella alexanderae TaxID=2877123 RepID=A0ABS7XWB2_9FLAO|nr:glutaminyl-peptide cyclotransferase [Winogradskyella alexanderae]MCA0133121.1 glutaminyl-peptide cyclotransferase [Winogradskyella alexanderae]